MKLPHHIRLGPITIATRTGLVELSVDLNKQLCDIVASQIVEIAILRAKLAYLSRFHNTDVGELIVEEYQRWRERG